MELLIIKVLLDCLATLKQKHKLLYITMFLLYTSAVYTSFVRKSANHIDFPRAKRVLLSYFIYSV